MLNDPRYDPARAAAARAFGSGQPGRSLVGQTQGGNDVMTPEQMDSLRRLTSATRQETCKYVLYVQRNKQTGQLDLPSRFAHMDASEIENDVVIVDVEDIEPSKFPTWLNRTPLLVVRRPDGHYIWKGERAIQFLEKLSRESVLGVPAGGEVSSQLGSYTTSTYRDPRYDKLEGKISDTSFDSYRALRERQDKLHAAKHSAKVKGGPGSRPGAEPPMLPAQDPKAPLPPEMLYNMGMHPSQLEKRRDESERKRFQALRENPARAMQGGY